MASDLSSGCNEVVEGLDEKEEGEISLEDVSSSEEGHVNYAYGNGRTTIARCMCCSSKQPYSMWCTSSQKHHYSRNQSKRDAVQGKENRHHTKELGSTGSKYPATTLQEKNDDLVPISSDSDMEIIELPDSSKVMHHSATRSKAKKKKKKRKSRSPGLRAENAAAMSLTDLSDKKYSDVSKHKTDAMKGYHLPRSFHRETSPTRRSSRLHPVKRSPLKRYRSPGRSRSPLKRSRSPLLRPRSPIARRSPRSTRSPRRSPYRSPLLAMRSAADSPHNELTQQLLKKVRDLKESMETESIETSIKRNKEHASSLKAMLSNMLKTMSDDKEDVARSKTESNPNQSKEKTNDRDDEEDLALLRQKALETKQSKAKSSSQGQNETQKKSIENINDDQDEEDLKLRLIALRSAVMKKRQDGTLRRNKTNKEMEKSTVIRSESPFTNSFLDSIPMPHGNYMSPPHTPPNLNENNHEEDMELDTDVEREKEKLPYSPTDKITSTMPTETEMLGIQTTDISFITPSKVNNSYLFPKYNGESQNVLPSSPYFENEYSPNLSKPTCEVNNADAPYSPSDSIETHIIPNERRTLSCVPLSRLLEASMKQRCERTELCTDHNAYTRVNPCQDMPYCPPDVSGYNSGLAPLVPPINTFGPSSGLAPASYFDAETGENLTEQRGSSLRSDLSSLEKDELSDRVSESTDAMSVNPAVGSAVSSSTQSPNDSMITIDDVVETDIDASPTPFVDPEASVELVPGGKTKRGKDSQEPLYMQGVPDITRDANKIPTLINRKLVPSRILKANKQLQQPLPPKKIETIPAEPTFKSAEMLPVSVDPEKAKCTIPFKSIKLVQAAKKSCSVLPTSAPVFVTLDEDVPGENAGNDGAAADEQKGKEAAEGLVETNLMHKRKKLRKRRSTPRTGLAVQVVDKRNNVDGKPLVHESKESAGVGLEEKTEFTQKCSEASRNDERGKEENRNVDQAEKVDEEGEAKDRNKRRHSVDEDEDELRALLLASLAKRTKPNDGLATSTPPVPSITSALETSTTSVFSKNPAQSTIENQSTTISVSEGDKIVCNSNVVPNLEITKKVFSNITVEVPTAQRSQTDARKRSITVGKSPSKKIVRKVSVPASTKVVNNAKKYQNMIVQRKLNLQKATSVYNAQRQGQSLSVVKSVDSKWSSNAIVTGGLENQRFVISLSSDSESEPEAEPLDRKVISRPVIPKSDFEKSIDEFLREARKKQEIAAAKPKSPMSTGKKNLAKDVLGKEQLDTPPAVRHLPASRQQEYHRLKQQIIEREKLKQKRKAERIGGSPNSKLPVTANASSSPNTLKTPASSSLVNTAQFQHSQPSNAKPPVEDRDTKSAKPANPSVPKNNKPIALGRVNAQNKVPNKQTTNREAVNEAAQVEVANAPAKPSTKTCEKECDTTTIAVKTPSLKILTKDQVNDKYLAQPRQETVHTSFTVVAKTNNNVAQTNNSSDNINLVNTSVNRVAIKDKPDASNVKVNATSNEQSIDSNASTVILSDAQTSKVSNESANTDETTLTLSQYLANESNESSVNDVGEKVSPDNAQSDIKEFWDSTKKDSVMELRGLAGLSQDEQRKRLMDTEHSLVTKRYSILDDLAEMLGNLRQWDMERDLQTSLVAEVNKLREQLKMAEERLVEQSNRVNDLTPRVIATNEKIHSGRLECYKLSRICSGLGTLIVGQDYKIPEAGAQLLENRIREVAAHSRELSKKIVPAVNLPGINAPVAPIDKIISTIETETSEQSIQSEETPASNESEELKPPSPAEAEEENLTLQMNDTCPAEPEVTSTPRAAVENKESESTEETGETSEINSCLQTEPEAEPSSQKSERQPKKTFTPYESILTHFKAPRNTNLDGILCPYELRGTCSDGDCRFVHYAANQDQ